MELLAYNAIGPARKLLLKHNMSDAKDEIDLQDKLTELYQTAKDKIEIEKEFAEIHPHKEFILKYCSPPPVETKVIVGEPMVSAEGGEIKIEPKKIDNNVLIASVAIVGIVGLVIYMTKK